MPSAVPTIMTVAAAMPISELNATEMPPLPPSPPLWGTVAIAVPAVLLAGTNSPVTIVELRKTISLTEKLLVM